MAHNENDNQELQDTASDSVEIIQVFIILVLSHTNPLLIPTK
jgi:hypothetical protein